MSPRKKSAAGGSSAAARARAASTADATAGDKAPRPGGVAREEAGGDAVSGQVGAVNDADTGRDAGERRRRGSRGGRHHRRATETKAPEAAAAGEAPAEPAPAKKGGGRAARGAQLGPPLPTTPLIPVVGHDEAASDRERPASAPEAAASGLAREGQGSRRAAAEPGGPAHDDVAAGTAAGSEVQPAGKTEKRAEVRRAGGRRRGAASGEAAATSASGSSSASGETRAPASAADGEAATSDAESAAGRGLPAAAEGEQASSDADGVRSRRRHRGSRGGRRRRRAADAEHDEAVREAEEAAGESAAAPPGSAAAVPAAAAAGETGEAGPGHAPAGGDRRGRRRRSSRTAAAGETAAAEAALEAEATGVAVPGKAGLTPEAEAPATEAPATEAPATETVPSEEPELAAPPAEGPATGEEAGAGDAAAHGGVATATARRRRRGGRGRLAHEHAAGEDEAPPLPEPSAPKPDAQKPRAETSVEARPRLRDRRRPKAIVRQDEGSGLATPVAAPSPRSLGVVADQPRRKLILVTDDGQELRVALVEDGRLAEIYIERPDKKSYLGDIYQGRVESVLGGIDAAFVDFGLEKNGFLYVDEVTAPEGEKRPRRITEALKNGQQVLVQVTKDPMGSKGARLSTKISLAGRYLVYVPGGSGVGVSRRLGQAERERLRELSRELKPKDAGLIVRTIAEGHGLDDLKRDLRYLSRLWSRLKKKAETVKAPGLVHKEADISIEVARDLFNDTCESLIVDDAKRHKAIVSFLEKEAPELLHKVHHHTGVEPLFEAYGIDEQIARALERRVSLPSGGNLMIDHAEALTVIDVNTGRFTRGKGLEDTITKTNIEAAKEVVRQLRLRDIGGIIIIDFIDMAHAKNRELVLATLEAELETDRTKTYVVELSPLGLVEMTRQNTTDGARGILTRTCPTCLGKARVLSDETMALNVERRVRALSRTSQVKAWLIEVNGGVAERLAGARLKALEKETGRRIFFEGSAALPVDTFRVLSEGAAAHVQEQRIPVREGQEVEIELEYSLTYSPRDAVGYVDGYMVIVEGGRQFLGQRRKVRVTGTARTGAQATVLKQGAN